MNSDSNNILKNEITLVTGASRGIGAGIAKLFGESGSYIIGTATTQEGADAITQRVNNGVSKGEGVVLDVSNSEDVNRIIKEMKERDLLPSILINNAGISLESLMMRIKDDDWKKIIDTNLTSTLFFAKEMASNSISDANSIFLDAATSVPFLVSGSNKVLMSLTKTSE